MISNVFRALGGLRASTTALAIALTVTAGVTTAGTPVQVANFTSFSNQDLSDYLAENLNSNLKAEISRRKLAVFAVTAKFDGKNACYAAVGLTAQAPQGRNTRFPVHTFSSFGTQPAKDWEKGNCVSERLRSAIDSLTNAQLDTTLDGIEGTMASGGNRAVEKANSGMVSLETYGLSGDNKKPLFDALHKRAFGSSFDYRYVQTSIFADGVQFDSGTYMCVAFAGLSGNSPSGRNFRWPGYQKIFTRLQSGGDIDGCKQFAAEQALDSLLDESWDEKGLLDSFAFGKEDGIPLPRAQRQQPQQQKQVTSTTRQTNRTSCTNDCINGSCVRKFPDGTTERWQAPRKFNPFNNNWEWDTTTNSCGL